MSIDDAKPSEWDALRSSYKITETISEPGQTDVVRCPEHYRDGDIECIDALRSMTTKEEFIGYCRCNAVKYVWRLPHKGKSNAAKIQDAEKAIVYLEWLIEAMKERRDDIRHFEDRSLVHP